MQEFLIMIGLSILMAFAAFAEVPDPYVQSGRSFPTSSDSRLSSVPRTFSLEAPANQRPVVPVVPNQGTAEFVDTSTQFSAAPERETSAPARAASTTTSISTSTAIRTGSGTVPSEPKGMPERRPKPSGFR